jgi:hypothetical protein
VCYIGALRHFRWHLKGGGMCARDDGAIWEADGYTLLCGKNDFVVAV